METAESEPPGEGLGRVLSEAERELHRAGLSLAQMVRTWYYIGDILGAGASVITKNRKPEKPSSIFPRMDLSWLPLRRQMSNSGSTVQTQRQCGHPLSSDSFCTQRGRVK